MLLYINIFHYLIVFPINPTVLLLCGVPGGLSAAGAVLGPVFQQLPSELVLSDLKAMFACNFSVMGHN